MGLIIGLVFFYVTIYAYTLGLKHGRQLSNDEIPEVKTPIELIKEVKKDIKESKLQHEQAEADKKYTESLQKLINYTGID